MSNPTERYNILYASAPYIEYEKTMGIFVNLQICTGDTITQEFAPSPSAGEPDILRYVITPSGQDEPWIFIPDPQLINKEVAQSLRVEMEVLLDGNNISFSRLCPYGVDEDYFQLQVVNYIAAPYKELLRSAYVIVNMPKYSNDVIEDVEFMHGGGLEPDVITIPVTSAPDPDSRIEKYSAVLGPFDLNVEDAYFIVQVSVNKQKPVASPIGKKSYGQDTISHLSGRLNA